MPAAEVAPLRSGDPGRLGAYDLQGRLGEGGQGVVYLGAGASGEKVAIKWLRPDLAGDPDMVERFLREVAAAKRVAPFCTAQVMETGVEAERPYIVSEYIEGPSLQRRVLTSGPISGPALHRLAIGTATALAAIHRAGIVHRDLKPANVIMGPDGPRVIDFGIARALDASSTLTSRPVGTPSYMAPEQIMGEPAGPPADLFAWGCTIAHAATGESPFGSDSLPAVINRILNGQPKLGDLQPPLRDVVVSCLARDPRTRPTAEQVLLGLLQHSAPSPAILQEAAAAASEAPGPPPATPASHRPSPAIPGSSAAPASPAGWGARQPVPPPPYPGPASDPGARPPRPDDRSYPAPPPPRPYSGPASDPGAHQATPGNRPYPPPPTRPYPGPPPSPYPPPMPSQAVRETKTLENDPERSPRKYGVAIASGAVAVLIVVLVAVVIANRDPDGTIQAGGTTTTSATPASTPSSQEPSPTPAVTAETTEAKLPGVNATAYESASDPMRLTYYEVENKRKNEWINYPRSTANGRFVKSVKYWQQAISPDGKVSAGRTRNYTNDNYHGVDLVDRATGVVHTVKTVKYPLTYEYADWTKDSRRLLLSIRNPGGSTWTTKGFIIVDVDAGTATVRKINDSSIKEGRFYWNGDGSMVATWFDNGTTKGIRYYDLDGDPVRTLEGVGMPYNTLSGLFSPSGASIVTKCADDAAKVCYWNATTGVETGRFGSDCTKVLGWWDEQHLFCWTEVIAGKSAVVVTDLRGQHLRTLLETTQAEILGPYYSRRQLGS